MKISDLIMKLEEAKKDYGDLPITTFSGFVQSVKLVPCKDGISYPMEKGTQNEISMEVMSS